MRLRSLTACLAALVLGFGPIAPVSADSARDRLSDVVGRLQDAEAREAVVRDRLVKLDREITRAERELNAISARIAGRARAAYVGGFGGDETVAVMLTTTEPGEVLSRLALLDASTRRDRALFDRARVMRRTLNGQKALAAATRKEAAAAKRSLKREAARLRELLSDQQAAERSSALRRRTRASRSTSVRLNGRYACLVGPNHAYRDTWGAPRSGGRRHKGTDVFAPYGSGSYAVTDGVITRLSTSYNGGLQVYLRGDDGNEYFYAHMSGYATRTGRRVRAGELIAYVGDSGNARGTSPHVHFEVHPGGGYPVNPYPYVRRFCA